MKPAETVSLNGSVPIVEEDANLDSLIDIASGTESALAVMNSAGALVGEIDQSMILKAMNSRG